MKADKKIIKLINEEISNFDFLGNDKHEILMESIELLENEDFQKQFIVDFLTGKSNKIQIINAADIRINGDWDTYSFDDAKKISLEYNIDIKYSYHIKKEPIFFNLSFNSDNISISVDGEISGDNIHEPRSESAWFNYINWLDVDVDMFSMEGDQIEFTAFKKSPERIRELFIREFIKDIIIDETGMEIKS